jgi:thiol-disulfide isomerase/thioredoxin
MFVPGNPVAKAAPINKMPYLAKNLCRRSFFDADKTLLFIINVRYDKFLNIVFVIDKLNQYAMRSSASTTIFAFLLAFIFQANAPVFGQEGYVITGITKGINSGTIRMFADDRLVSVADSATIAEGKFVMKGKIGSPERRIFTITPGNWTFRALVEDAVITFTLDTMGALNGKYYGGFPIIQRFKETGSEIADVDDRFKKETNQAYDISTLSSLFQALSATKTDIAAANLKHSIDSVGKFALTKQKAWIENYINHYPASIAGVYVFSEYWSFLNELKPSRLSSDLQSVLDQFSGAAKTSVFYQRLATEVTKLRNKETDHMAPDFTLQQRDKAKFTLSSTRGKVTMIDFWASWCVPCRAAIPHWKKVYAKYHPKGFNIVSIADDQNRNDWIRALDKEQMPWVQVIDEFPVKRSTGKITDLFSIRSIPFYVLLNKEGKVILASADDDMMAKKIEEFLQ